MPKIAIVTGAGSGIGKGVALALLQRGLRGRSGRTTSRSSGADRRRSRATRRSGRWSCRPTSAIRPSIEALFSRTKERFGRLDLLFNNAGRFAPPVPLEDLTVDVWQDVVNVNLTGPFLCTQHAFRLMKDQQPRGGRIINNGSISAHVPRPNSAPYTSTKHAITGLTRSTSLDGRKYDIACGQIDIGNAATEPMARVPQGVMQAHGAVASEPMMDVEHVARAVVYMASLPLEANVQFMTIMATKMPFIGRG